MEVRFLSEYIKHPMAVGAILPSSKRLAQKMVNGIDFNNCKCIVEYGPGTGVFTEEILKSRSYETKVVLIEYNYEFYNILKRRYKNEKNIYIINDSAENIYKYLVEYDISKVEYIVSGLPFASLPSDMGDNILRETKRILGRDGTFITFQYTQFKKAFIKNYFKDISINKEYLNIPPAYIFSCNN